MLDICAVRPTTDVSSSVENPLRQTASTSDPAAPTDAASSHT